MIRSMLSAVSSLRNHQTFMDVVANNIANINTPAFKSSRIGFQELMTQTYNNGRAPSATMGGVNPLQIGLGMAVGGVDTLFTQGTLQNTGRASDLAIQGDGFFIIQNPTNNPPRLYTRDGSFGLDSEGNLVSLATGFRVLGWAADANGVINPTVEPLAINIGSGGLERRVTSDVTMAGNLDASAQVAQGPNDPPEPNFSSVVSVVDSLGVEHNVKLTFWKTDNANRTWTVRATSVDPALGYDNTVTPPPPPVNLGETTLSFTDTGALVYDPADPTSGIWSLALTPTGAAAQTVDFNFRAITQLGSSTSVNVKAQDGVPAGSLTGFTIRSDGTIACTYSNGLTRVVGQVALARFQNPAGLLRDGQNLYETSANSGIPVIGAPGTMGLGITTAGSLEMSNVDLAKQLTDMIIAQRGFQANSRVITASDQMLSDLVNLAR